MFFPVQLARISSYYYEGAGSNPTSGKQFCCSFTCHFPVIPDLSDIALPCFCLLGVGHREKKGKEGRGDEREKKERGLRV